MASFSIVNRSPDGSTYFAEAAMGNWTYGTIVEIQSNTIAWPYAEMDYLTIQMSAVAGFPPLFFRVYGHFNITNGYNSDNAIVPYVRAGSLINRIEVIDATGKVYSAIDGISFAVNSDKTSFANEDANIFANSFRPGETPDVAVLLNGNDLIQGNSGTEFLFGYGGNDSLYGGNTADALFGGNGHDQLFGGLGSDDLYGDAGNDTIYGYDGSDYIDGGADFDTWQITGTYTTGISIPPLHNLTAVSFYGIEAIKIVYGEIVLNSAQVGGASWVQTIIGGSAYRDSLRVMALDNMAVNLDGVTFIDWNNWSGEMDRVTIYGFAGNDTITGSQVNDVIFTMAGNNWVRAGTGEDVVSAGDGHDTLWGGVGGDRLTGWGGNDILQGGSDTALVEVGGDDSLYGGLGNDTLRAGAGFNIIDGGDGIDTLDYRFAVQTVYPNETVTVSTVIDLSRLVNPNDPNSTYSAYVNTAFSDISITMTRDVVVNVEHVEGSERSDQITGNDLANRLRGWGGNDTLRGLGSDDSLLGGLGDDSLEGGIGNDVLAGETGNDSIDGGDGIDTVVYADPAAITVNLNTILPQATGQGSDRLIAVENVMTSSGADRLYGNGAANLLSAGLGNDILTGGAGNDSLLGGSGNDGLRGDAGDDLINGGSDIDSLYFLGAVNTTVNLTLTTAQITGHGSDTILGIEHVTTEGGADRLTGNGAANLFSTGLGNDTLIGGAGNDSLLGGDGNDYLRGEAGNDQLNGGNGIDSAAFLGAVNTTVNLGLTTAQATGHGNDILVNIENVITDSGADRITGNAAANYLAGGVGNDTLSGGLENDTLVGGDGNDLINGGAGNDSLVGSLGADSFTYYTGYGSDRIRDFQNGVDKLRIVTGAESFAGVTITDSGLDTLVSFGGVTLRLENFVHTNVDASDFLFV